MPSSMDGTFASTGQAAPLGSFACFPATLSMQIAVGRQAPSSSCSEDIWFHFASHTLSGISNLTRTSSTCLALVKGSFQNCFKL